MAELEKPEYTDLELVAFVEKWYGAKMAMRVKEMFDEQPAVASNFVANVRRSLTNEKRSLDRSEARLEESEE